jgi:hypothetical protein
MPVAPPEVAAWFVPHQRPTVSPAFKVKTTSEYPQTKFGSNALFRACRVKIVVEFATSAAEVDPFTRNQTIASWIALSLLAN